MRHGAPDAALTEAFEATWPAVETAAAGGFLVGRGEGGGGRVSSARAVRPDWTAADIEAAEALHRGWGQPALFRVPEGETRLEAALAARGYAAENPTLILAAPLAVLTDRPLPGMTAFALWPPLAVQAELWEAGGIGPARQAVMARVPGPRVSLLGRAQDRAGGAGFVAVHGTVAMLHALEVRPELRRHGLGAALVRRAALWAAGQGAERLGLAVSLANAAAVRLYDGLGFEEAARYAYWRRAG